MTEADKEFVSEADFVCRFLASELREYAVSRGLDLMMRLEEPMGDGADGGRADLTVRSGGRRLIVIEAKLRQDPWDLDVVMEGFAYSPGFDFFATANPKQMILFAAGPDPFESALALIKYDADWVARVMSFVSHPPMPKPLYTELLVEERVLSRGDAELYDDLRRLSLEDEKSTCMSEAPYRLYAVSGMRGSIGKSLGRYWDLGTAIHNKSVLESSGWRIKVQRRNKEGWEDLDVSQSKLDE